MDVDLNNSPSVDAARALLIGSTLITKLVNVKQSDSDVNAARRRFTYLITVAMRTKLDETAWPAESGGLVAAMLLKFPAAWARQRSLAQLRSR
jgi:hypothetical protein